MTGTPKSVDIENAPNLRQVIEEVAATHERVIVQRNGENIAIIEPADTVRRASARRMRTKEDLNAFQRLAGAWKDVDTDQLLKDIYESRDLHTRPNVEL